MKTVNEVIDLLRSTKKQYLFGGKDLTSLEVDNLVDDVTPHLEKLSKFESGQFILTPAEGADVILSITIDYALQDTNIQMKGKLSELYSALLVLADNLAETEDISLTMLIKKLLQVAMLSEADK